jgi:archaellin
MNNQGGMGIFTAIILVSFLLIAATVTSVMTGENSENFTIIDIEKMVNDAAIETSTYIQIKDTMGKFESIDNKQRIQKIAILIKPLFSIDVDVSDLIIKLSNEKVIKLLQNGKQPQFINSNTLFEHTIWTNMNSNIFNFIVVLDKDKSLLNYNIINDNTDTAYIILKLSDDFAMKKGDSMTITLFPSRGVTRTISLEAPMPMNTIVSLL